MLSLRAICPVFRVAHDACFSLRTRHSSSLVSLRPYQEACIESCLDALARGVHRIGVSSPTGSGKTTIFGLLLGLIPPRSPNAKRVIVLVGSIELARQAVERIRSLNEDLRIEIEQGKNEASGYADVTVATVQTLAQDHRLFKFRPELFKAVIVDEAHHAAARTWLKILHHFDPTLPEKIIQESPHDATQDSADESKDEVHENGINSNESLAASLDVSDGTCSTPMNIIGFSATFVRHDMLALSAAFDEIVFHIDFVDMIRDRWLSPCRFTTINADVNLQDVKISTATGDLVPSSLAQVINDPRVNDLIITAYLEKAADRKSTLVFAVDVDHVNALVQAFISQGIEAKGLVGTTNVVDRFRMLEDFRAGAFPVLVNCAILREGADIPNIDCVLLAKPTLSRNLFSQMIGRGLRLSPGKEDCLILDLVGNLERGLVCSPSLFGLSPQTPLEDVPIDDLFERAQAEETSNKLSGEINDEGMLYKNYTTEELLAKSEASDSPTNIRRLSPLAWVSVGDDEKEIYILEARNGRVRISREIDGYSAYFVRLLSQGGKRLYTMPVTVNKVAEPDFERMVRMADTYAKQVLGARSYGALLRSAKWRQDPASEAQRQRLQTRLRHDLLGFLRLLAPRADWEKLTKGQAADALTMLANGAKGRIARQEKVQVKRFAKESAEKRKEASMKVKVGPL